MAGGSGPDGGAAAELPQHALKVGPSWLPWQQGARRPFSRGPDRKIDVGIIDPIDGVGGPLAKAVWPDSLDLGATLVFLFFAFVVPAIGYMFMVADLRAYLRSLRRSLVVVRAYFSGIPEWAREKTPASLSALGLTLPCTEEDLLRAYRERVKALHPDRGGDRRKFLRLQRDFERAAHFLQDRRPTVAKGDRRN